MRIAATIAILTAFVAPALADEPTVSLTQAELQAIVKAESTKAIAQYEASSANSVYKKLQAAFAPRPAAVPIPSPSPAPGPEK